MKDYFTDNDCNIESPVEAKATSGGTKYHKVRHEVSAGGIVVKNLEQKRSAQEIALIGKYDKKGRLVWTLPKGHREAKETLSQTALREIKEETGLGGKIIAKLGMIKYSFIAENTKINKDVHHFLVQYTTGTLNDEDPEVAEVIWIPLMEAYQKLVFEDEVKLLRQAEKVLLHQKRMANTTGTNTPPPLATEAFIFRRIKRKQKK